MLIILEGTDGAGKTTLAAELATRIERRAPGSEIEVLHRGPPERHPLEEYVLDLDGYRPGRGRHVVCDRWHWGEMLYGPLYRGESKLGGIDGPGHRYIDLYLRSRGALVVHVTAPLEVVSERCLADGEDYLQAEDFKTIWEGYQRVDAATRMRVERVPGHGERDLDLLLDFAFDEAKVAASVTATERWLGNPYPVALLVGDETSPRHLRGERPTFKAPFVPYPDGCGWYLFDALPTDLWPAVAVANAAEVPLADLWLDLGSPSIVALGGAAAEALEAAGLPHARVPHPQYVRRFHHERSREYGRLIEDVIGTEREVTSWT